MPRPKTGNPVGRPATYATDDERPTTVSLRIPHDLHEQAKQYVRMRSPMTLTELLLDGLRLRLDTPTDPRDIILSDDNTVIQELQDMIRTAVQAEVGKVRDFIGARGGAPGRIPGPEATVGHVPELSHDNNTVLQEGATPAHVADEESPPTPELSHDENTVIQERVLLAHEQDCPPTPASPVPPTPDISHDNNTVIQQPDVSSASAGPDEASGPAPRPAPDKAAIVAMLEAMRAEGLSLREMADQLQAEGVPTITGKGRWQKGTLSKLLSAAMA